MVCEDGTSNGDGIEERVQKSGMIENGFGLGFDSGEGSSGGSEGFRTYKRRKSTRLSWDSKGQEDGRCFMEAASKLADQVAYGKAPSFVFILFQV